MPFKRHFMTILFTGLTVTPNLLAAPTVQLTNFQDAYPSRETLLQKSKLICSSLLPIAIASPEQIQDQTTKHGFGNPSKTKITKNSQGWTADIYFLNSSAKFLRLIKLGSSFIVSYRQKETDLEGILDATLEENCTKIQDAKFTIFNSEMRAAKRLKMNSMGQITRIIPMEESVRDAKPATQALIRIGVIDSGVDYNHPDLIEKTRPLIGIDLTNPSRPPFDYTNTVQNELMGRHFSHGSAVADIASRNLNVLIVPVRTENQSTLNGRAVEFLAQQKVRLVNLSQGTAKKEDWLSFREAVITHPEMLFIVSSGNNGFNLEENPVYPSTFDLPNVLVVASVDSENRLSTFSNYSSRYVHVAAIGENVSAALAGGGQWVVNGTSFAAPLVTRIAARLLISEPNMTAGQLRNRLVQKARAVPGLIGKVKYGVLVDDAGLSLVSDNK